MGRGLEGCLRRTVKSRDKTRLQLRSSFRRTSGVDFTGSERSGGGVGSTVGS